MDRYTEIAAQAFNKPAASVTPEERRLAKDLEFGRIYGGNRLAKAIVLRPPCNGIVIDETSIVLNFDRLDAKIANWLQSSVHGDRS
jgi:hypothetical protein